MIESNKKISAYQLFCLLILTRLSAEIVFPSTVTSDAVGSIAALIISELVMFVLALPVIMYSFRGEDFWGAICRKNRFIGWIVAIAAAVIALGAGLLTLFYSAEFSVKHLVIGGSMWLLFVIGVIFAIFTAIMGAEASARSAAIFLVGGALVTIMVILADIPYMKLTASEVMFSGKLDIFMDEVGKRLMRGGDYLIFSAMLPYVNKQTTASAGKCGLLFALFSALFTVILCVVSCLVLRELYGVSEYPFIAAASLSDIAFFKRLDGAAAAIWGLCAVFRGGVLLLSAVQILEKVYGASKNKRQEGAR